MRAELAKLRPVVVTEALIRRHQVGVWRYLRFLGAPADLAEDLTQETFVALLEARVDDRGAAALAGWLRTTARRRLAATRRKLRPELDRVEAADVDAVFVQSAGEDGAATEYRAALDACIETLATDERELLERHYGGSVDRAALAAEFGVAVEGIKTRLRRVKARLRACMKRRMSE